MQNLEADHQLQQAIQILKNNFDIKRIFLFGSRAQGTAHSDSDYDLVLITKDSLHDPFENRVKARVVLKDLSSSFDVFVYTNTEFEKVKNDFGSIAETAVNTGREIELS